MMISIPQIRLKVFMPLLAPVGLLVRDDYDDQHPSNKVESIYALVSSSLFTC